MRITLKEKSRPILALSGFQKASFCFFKEKEAFIADKSWDLSIPEAISEFKTFLQNTLSAMGTPEIIAHDFHPDFYTTQTAKELASSLNIPAIAVRHHHAHIATVAGEHHFSEPLLGFALDGFGLGEHNEAWGGELLFVKNGSYQRLGRLNPLCLPGGDISVIRPELLAAAFYHEHKDKNETLIHFPNLPAIFWEGLSKKINCQSTSSCGRYFDLACELLQIKEKTQIETLLHFERLAANPRSLNLGFKIIESEGIKNLHLEDMLLLLQSYKTSEAADIFHGTLAEGLAALATECAKETGIRTIALSGGCIFNRVLKSELQNRLTEKGFKVLLPKNLSAGDESISFGMAIAVSSL